MKSKVAAFLLCFAILLCGASCSSNVEDGIPDGMMIASATGADYRLYVPTTWNLNTAYGVSGAYFNLSRQSTVSVVKYGITGQLANNLQAAELSDGGMRLDWFWENECKPAIDSVSLGGSVQKVEEETNALLLDTENAHRYHVTATVNGETLHFVHVIAEKNNAFYVVSFTVTDSLYASLLSGIENILEEFVFSDTPYMPDDYAKKLDENADAPDGMKLASNDDVAYRFYVPTDWTVNRDETVFSAYLASDRSNVSVVPYMPDEEGVSVESFFKKCKAMLEITMDSELTYTAEACTLGGRDATAYSYRYTVGDTEYQYKQVIAVYGSMLYSLTYTALPENFDAHLAEVEAIIGAFTFR